MNKIQELPIFLWLATAFSQCKVAHPLGRGCFLLILALVAYTLIPLEHAAFAQESNVTGSIASIEAIAKVDKNEVTIGDTINLSVRVRYKDNIAVQFPDLNQQIGVFTIKKTEDEEVPKREKGGHLVVERNYVLSSYEIGHQTIPPLNIKYKGTRGEGEVATNEVTVDIKGVLKEGETASDIKEILPPVDVPTNFIRLVLWIIVGLAVFLLSGIIYWLISRRNKGQKKHEREFIKRTPHEVAYELLERLAKEELVAKGLVKEYYYRITNIVRHYIESRFGLSAPERTTEEFLKELAHTNKLSDNHKLLIREFLESCDMVKYAKYGPSMGEVKETYNLAKRLVDETKERLEEKEVVVGRK